MGKRTPAARPRIWIAALLWAILMWPTTDCPASDGAGLTGAGFLQIEMGARAAGLGGAYTALADGAEAAFWNPAGLSLEPDTRGDVVLSHYSWMQDSRLEHGAVRYDVSPGLSLAGSFVYLGYGSIDGYSMEGRATGEQVSAFDALAAISASYCVGADVSIGGTVGLIHQRLDNLSASTPTFDIGLNLHHGRYSMAALAANIGPDVQFGAVSSPQPTSLNLAGAARLMAGGLILTGEVELPRTGPTAWRSGAELVFEQRYALRGGFVARDAQGVDRATVFPSFGVGLKGSRIRADYAVTLGDRYTDELLHRFTLILPIGR